MVTWLEVIEPLQWCALAVVARGREREGGTRPTPARTLPSLRIYHAVCAALRALGGALALARAALLGRSEANRLWGERGRAPEPSAPTPRGMDPPQQRPESPRQSPLLSLDAHCLGEVLSRLEGPAELASACCACTQLKASISAHGWALLRARRYPFLPEEDAGRSGEGACAWGQLGAAEKKITPRVTWRASQDNSVALSKALVEQLNAHSRVRASDTA